MRSSAILRFGFRLTSIVRMLPTFTHGPALVCFKRSLVASSSLECSHSLVYSHVYFRVALLSSHRWGSSSVRGSRSTSKAQTIMPQKVLHQRKKITTPLSPKKDKTKAKSPKKRSPKCKLTPHQLQVIKYNKRVGAIAKLWGEQKKSLAEQPPP
ncbi:unnamed protein product [Phytomonas sp. EM1]|nr:unnamed protein product [Phytomonas sp. EM1]|eukprot:CCW63260.1 unnamed protein product [Phytomonas sp. isolate EM1]